MLLQVGCIFESSNASLIYHCCLIHLLSQLLVVWIKWIDSFTTGLSDNGIQYYCKLLKD